MPPIDSIIPQPVLSKLAELARQYDETEQKLADPEIASDHRVARELSIRKAALEPTVTGYRQLARIIRDIADCRAQIASPSDPDLAALAKEELPGLEDQAATLAATLKANLVQSDDNRVGSIILEIRAGTGGDEAALWARDILDMFQRYSVKRGWSWEVMDLTTEADAGGLRSAVINVRGQGVWTAMNFEAGVHSVKRVPATEAQGRIHTSTATVAVLPEPEQVEVKIDWAKDVEEQATRAQGPGGQNVNKVETAWQIHHKPSGIIIKMMEAKSQQQNRDRARRLLMIRLHEAERQKKHSERASARSAQIGGGDRSEKIRTYRYKEGIVADERLPGEYALRDLLAGDFVKLHNDLIDQETARRIGEL